MLSVGEQGLTILSIAYQICCLLSRRRSVLQVIDNQFVTSLDHETLNRYLKFLSRPRQNFQTILVLQETSILSTLTDWRVFVMQRSKNGVEIVQDYGTGLARFA